MKNVIVVLIITRVNNYHPVHVDEKSMILMTTVAAFREAGKGYTAIETVCGFMNICPPMNESQIFTSSTKRLFKTI